MCHSLCTNLNKTCTISYLKWAAVSTNIVSLSIVSLSTASMS